MSTRPTLLERLRLGASSRRANRKGLALLDVLIGMAIFALIAVIAVVALGQFRQRAFMTGASSDAKSLGTAIEANATDSGIYPAAGTTGLHQLTGTDAQKVVDSTSGTDVTVATLTKNDYLVNYKYIAADATNPTAGFSFCIYHKSTAAATDTDGWAAYNSLKGGVVAQGDTPTGMPTECTA